MTFDRELNADNRKYPCERGHIHKERGFARNDESGANPGTY